MLGQKNVTGVATIHHSLGHVDSSARYVGATIHVSHTADRPAMNSHAHPQFRVAPQRLLISIAQDTGASGVVAKTSAIPSPVGSAALCPLGSAERRFALTISLSSSSNRAAPITSFE